MTDAIVLTVAHGVELTDGVPVAVVYLVDRTVPLVERTYALPVREAVSLAAQIMFGYQRGYDPVRALARDRDAVLVELQVPAAAATQAYWTIGRHIEEVHAMRCRTHREAVA